MTFQTSSMGRVIDALIAIPAADVGRSGLYLATSTMPAVTVSDGPWNTDVIPDEIVIIGISASENATGQGNSGTQSLRRMGGPLQAEEAYDVLCAIRVWDADGTSAKKCRDRCEALFSVYEYALRHDPTLGGAVAQSAQIHSVGLNQDDPLIEDGSTVWLSWTVHISNVLLGS